MAKNTNEKRKSDKEKKEKRCNEHRKKKKQSKNWKVVTERGKFLKVQEKETQNREKTKEKE